MTGITIQDRDNGPVSIRSITIRGGYDDGYVSFRANRTEWAGVNETITIIISPEELRDALNQIEGFTVAYEEPVHVPQGLGAVVRVGADPDHNNATIDYTRNASVGAPWTASRMGKPGVLHWVTDELIALHLRNGARILSEGVTD